MRWPWSKKEMAHEQTHENESSAEPLGRDDTAPSTAAKEAPAMSEASLPETSASPSEVQPEVQPDVQPEVQTEVQSNKAPSELEQRIVEALKTVYDPEIPVDIYELGLIYEVDVREQNSVYVKMTLTSPMCPVAETLPPEVEEKVRLVEGVSDVQLDLVWEPPWEPDMMSEAAKLELNM